ncbi:HAD-IB family phosphatase [Sphingomonadales bacterium 56]|uniref:HAD family hydrolase n=1 Tax=unclassified Sphingobium TaxID=2611147 RepID=UPI0019190BDF|nr:MULTISPECIES: HAD-IB family phosphatase [unclassified Sphingobium]MBY2929122.1 HAD-IB family phosphatase [Sphingomonadales bacterium 56]MBY2959026.1 HAD-IB family phosphatase [Sphingomonadales bacterium 58]CAD7338464.1 putative phosphatase [Sphingobium sp. S6]CAD7338505.1 putative phosphatase [Sphingobium sp. S8]
MTHRLAIYDMDRTVTFSGTYTGFLIHVSKAMAPWRLVLLPCVILLMLAYVFKLISRQRLKELNQALMIGFNVERTKLMPHVESYAAKVVANNVRAGALEQIARDRADGYRLVLATASYRLYVEPIARRLGFDAVIATDHLSQDLRYVRAKIAGENCYDTGKLRMIKAWMAAEAIDREQAQIRAYSDHVSDAPMLEFADMAFASNPHKPLARLAAAKGWPRVDWL